MKIIQKVISFYKTKPTLIFPTIVGFLVLLLSSLSISGTSSGIIHDVLYGSQSPDHSLVFGKPQAIRSDEFLVNTQLTIIQVLNGMPRINPDIDGGKDMSLIVDVPYKEWSAFFRPQNWAFFILPISVAFAFKWWLLIGLLVLSIYYFSLRFLKNNILLAALLAIALSCSPFIWWWYQTGTIATLYYGLFILIVTMNIIDRKQFSLIWKSFSPRTSLYINTVILVYLLVCFALILYPPFQLPVVLVSIFFILGYSIQRLQGTKLSLSALRLLPLFVAAVVSLSLVGVFLLTRSNTVETITSTAYPGKRAEGSGGYDVWRLLSVYLQPQLQRGERGSHYFVNQSESANFLIHPLFLFIPSVLLLVMLYIKSRKFDWILLFIVLCNLLFLVHLFVPAFSEFNRLLLLQLSPPPRAIIGFGFLGIINLIYILSAYSKLAVAKKNIFLNAIAVSLVLLAVLLIAGFKTSSQYPQFISNAPLIVFLATIFTAVFFLFMLKKYIWASVILCIFSVASIAFVHPLYRGVGPISDPRLLKSIQAASNDNAMWGYSGLIYFENSIQMAGRDSITGTIFYPNVSFWKKYATEPSQNFIYNRYAHILMSDQKDEMKLLQPDLYNISYRCDMDIMQDLDFILSTSPIDEDCLSLQHTERYPNVSFYIYKNQLSK